MYTNILSLGGRFTRISKPYPGWNKRNNQVPFSIFPPVLGRKNLERLFFQFSSWTASISSLWYIQEILMWQEWESNLKITGNTDTSTLAAFLSGKPGSLTWSPPVVLLPWKGYLLWSWNCTSHFTAFKSFFFVFLTCLHILETWLLTSRCYWDEDNP